MMMLTPGQHEDGPQPLEYWQAWLLKTVCLWAGLWLMAGLVSDLV